MAKRPPKDKQTTVNISMPARLRTQVDAKMRAGGFGNVSEYFRHLVRNDLDVVQDERRRLRKMLDEGDRSGPVIEADDKFWAQMRAIARSGGRARRKAG